MICSGSYANDVAFYIGSVRIQKKIRPKFTGQPLRLKMYKHVTCINSEII